MLYYVYILRSDSNKLYIGQTNNLIRREKEQLSNSTKTAKYVKDNQVFRPVFYETFSTRKQAMNREMQIKGWSRAKKEALITGDLELLKKLSKGYTQK